ncbi:carboxymuconolactone decarboxylase family protein [Stygiobacter electus]|uniref:Carboxymuconolactone decarboxylase family protein n=1 Tax=Stygiobacter electus TaxID=3032292 RepID=A0AAE3P546_9BACT|nr:carboxymuconolactone decarboxylase family protein [Stygiobacter electus]MDF1613225.1 carboxymuconolactone decarboxylase family protein [Stygiobacter electus]
MEKRISIKDLEPDAYKAMFQMEKYLSSCDLEKKYLELIKVRASQINGCAYCIEIHVKDALEMGESQRRLFALSAWWESPLFNEKEKIILKMTEEISMIADKGLTTSTYERAIKHFSNNEIAQIIMQIITINSWNRIAISTHMVHEE